MLFRKGQTPWNKGINNKPQCTDCGVKLKSYGSIRCKSCAAKKRDLTNFLKVARINRIGKVPWNKGLTTPGKVKEKQSEAHKKNPTKYWLGKKRLDMVGNEFGFKRGNMKGEKHWNWKGGVGRFRDRVVQTLEWQEWRKKVFERDDYTCQICGERGCCLHPHHKVKSFAKILQNNNVTTLGEARECKELWNLDNGETLCVKCHRQTDTWGGRVIKFLQ